MTSHAVASTHGLVSEPRVPPAALGSRLKGVLSEAGSLLVLMMFVPIAILVVGGPIAYVVGLMISLLERL